MWLFKIKRKRLIYIKYRRFLFKYKPNAFVWYLAREGMLAELTKEEKKCVCRINWEV